MEDYAISDHPEGRNPCKFPAFLVQPRSFVLIIADGQVVVDEFIHVNFKLNADGEKLTLFNKNGKLIDFVEVPYLDRDISYSRVDEQWMLLEPTPGRLNENAITPTLPKPLFTLPSGIYDNSVNIAIESEITNAQLVLYINDLDEPIITKRRVLDTIFDHTTQICAQTLGENDVSSELTCRTYIIGRQHTVPIVSIAASSMDLFDETFGMFSKGPFAQSEWPFLGANFWRDLQSKVYFEYFNTGSDTSLNAICDIEMHGGRESRTNEQKSFRLIAKQKYGQDYFDFPFFEQKPTVTKFKKIVLRNGSGDYGHGYCRDAFLHDYFSINNIDLDLDLNAYQPAAVYINGKYYGYMSLREKMDRFYPFSNFDCLDIDLLENQRVVLHGDSIKFKEDIQFVLNNDLSDPYNYRYASGLFDVEQLINYFHVQLGMVSTAWPQNNIKYWRKNTQNGQWRFLLFDMDVAMGRHPWTLASQNAVSDKFEKYSGSNDFIDIVLAFLEQPIFYRKFMNRHQDLFNTLLNSEEIIPAFLDFKERMKPEMLNHFERWTSDTYDEWDLKRTPRITDFLEVRPDYAMTFMDEYFDLGGLYEINISVSDTAAGSIDLNTLSDLDLPFTGKYFKEVPIQLVARSKDGYFFDHWEIGDQNYRSPELDILLTEDKEIKAVFSTSPPSSMVNYLEITDTSLKIGLNNSSPENWSFTLYAMQGYKVANFIGSSVQFGSIIYEFPLQISAAGTYILRMQQREKIIIEKITYSK